MFMLHSDFAGDGTGREGQREGTVAKQRQSPFDANAVSNCARRCRWLELATPARLRALRHQERKRASHFGWHCQARRLRFDEGRGHCQNWNGVRSFLGRARAFEKGQTKQANRCVELWNVFVRTGHWRGAIVLAQFSLLVQLPFKSRFDAIDCLTHGRMPVLPRGVVDSRFLELITLCWDRKVTMLEALEKLTTLTGEFPTDSGAICVVCTHLI